MGVKRPSKFDNTPICGDCANSEYYLLSKSDILAQVHLFNRLFCITA